MRAPHLGGGGDQGVSKGRVARGRGSPTELGQSGSVTKTHWPL